MLYVMFSIKPGHFGTNMTALLSVAHKIVYIQAFDVFELELIQIPVLIQLECTKFKRKFFR